MSESHAADSPDDERRAQEENLRRRNAVDRAHYLIKECETGEVTLMKADAALLARYVKCLQRGLQRQVISSDETKSSALQALQGMNYL
jgi:hypothetical protein